MDDAVDFYAKIEGSHIVEVPYLGEGRQQEIFYVNKPVEFSGDPDTGMDFYTTAVFYPSFVEGSVESTLEEFSCLVRLPLATY